MFLYEMRDFPECKPGEFYQNRTRRPTNGQLPIRKGTGYFRHRNGRLPPQSRLRC